MTTSLKPGEMRLELVPIPVTDIDRARDFYVQQCGWDLITDHVQMEDMRIVQIVPPGSHCAILLGRNIPDITDMAAGVQKGMHLVVPDVAEEVRGVEWAQQRLRQLVVARVDREQQALDGLRSRPALADPRSLVAERVAELHVLRDRARRTFGHRLDRAADDVAHQRARARALSPLETLRRGYAVLQDEHGHVLTSVAGAGSLASTS